MTKEHGHKVYVQGRIERFVHAHGITIYASSHSHPVVQQAAPSCQVPRKRRKA
jgi:hypothetical protein